MDSIDSTPLGNGVFELQKGHNSRMLGNGEFAKLRFGCDQANSGQDPDTDDEIYLPASLEEDSLHRLTMSYHGLYQDENGKDLIMAKPILDAIRSMHEGQKLMILKENDSNDRDKSRNRIWIVKMEKIYTEDVASTESARPMSPRNYPADLKRGPSLKTDNTNFGDFENQGSKIVVQGATTQQLPTSPTVEQVERDEGRLHMLPFEFTDIVKAAIARQISSAKDVKKVISKLRKSERLYFSESHAYLVLPQEFKKLQDLLGTVIKDVCGINLDTGDLSVRHILAKDFELVLTQNKIDQNMLRKFLERYTVYDSLSPFSTVDSTNLEIPKAEQRHDRGRLETRMIPTRNQQRQRGSPIPPFRAGVLLLLHKLWIPRLCPKGMNVNVQKVLERIHSQLTNEACRLFYIASWQFDHANIWEFYRFTFHENLVEERYKHFDNIRIAYCEGTKEKLTTQEVTKRWQDMTCTIMETTIAELTAENFPCCNCVATQPHCYSALEKSIVLLEAIQKKDVEERARQVVIASTSLRVVDMIEEEFREIQHHQSDHYRQVVSITIKELQDDRKLPKDVLMELQGIAKYEEDRLVAEKQKRLNDEITLGLGNLFLENPKVELH